MVKRDFLDVVHLESDYCLKIAYKTVIRRTPNKMNQVPNEIFLIIVAPLNIVDISRLFSTCKGVNGRYEPNISHFEQKERRMHQYINIKSMIPVPNSRELEHLFPQEQRMVLNEFIDMSSDNPRLLFKKFVYLNMPSGFASTYLLNSLEDMFKRIHRIFNQKAHLCEDEYLGIVIASDSGSWYDYTITGSFNLGLFELANKDIGLYKKEYEIEKAGSWVTRFKGNLILWLSMDLIKCLKLDEDEKIRLNELFVIGIGEKLVHCPKFK